MADSSPPESATSTQGTVAVARALRAQALLAAVHEAIVWLDSSHLVVDIDGDPVSLFGRTTEALLGAPLRSLLTEESEAHYQRLSAVISARGSVRVRFYVRHADGSAVPAEAVLASLPSAAPGIALMLRSTRDLGRTDAALGAPCGCHVVGTDGTVLGVNTTELRWLGYAREEVVGRKVWDLMAGESRAATERDYVGDRSATDRATAGAVEREMCRKDGSTFWVLISSDVFANLHGQAEMTYSTLVDITDRKHAERVAEEQAASVRQVLDQASDIVQVIDDQHRLIYVNPAWCAALGYTPEEARALTLFDVLAPESRVVAQSNLETLVREPAAALRQVERVLITKDGRRIPVEGRISARVEHGRFVGAQAFYTDVTQRRAAEEAARRSRDELAAANDALREASRAKDDFLASMSHELRTPLNAILGLSEALQEEVYGPINARQHVAIGRVEESGRHLLALINDVLDVAKVEAGKLTLDLSPVEPTELARAGLRLVHEAAQRKSLSVVAELGPSLGPALLDDRRMKQALLNLLSNAVKFTPEGGEIGISVSGDAATLRFVVWDRGIGIAPADAARLFQPFVQVDASLSRRHTGSGLGLALTRRLVELHGGTIELESEPGKGSRFTVCVPRRSVGDAARPLPAESAAPPASPVVARRCVLVVDDDDANVAVLHDFLIDMGCDVHVAHNGAEGIELARRLEPEVILMDVQMPGMDGLEATRIIRADTSLEVRTTPIIALTALAMPGDRERSLAAGADEYLSKPVRLRSLINVIEALAARRGGRRPTSPTG